MNQLLSIVDDALVIKKLSVETLDGPTLVTDDLTVQGSLKADDVKVSGTITVDTLKVKKLINEQESVISKRVQDFTFLGRTDDDLYNKGLTYADEKGTKQFVYRTGNKLWSTMNIELDRDLAYQINGVTVLSQNSLGSTVTQSNLTRIGKLRELTVNGYVSFDDWIFFNNNVNRLGINTESPNGTVGVLLENAAEFIINNNEEKVVIGTITSNDLNIVTDNTVRIQIKNTGETIFGNDKYKNAKVRINGTLEVDRLITAGADKDHLPITYRTTETTSVQGTGFLWQHANKNRQFTYNLDPDRIYSSETIDLHKSKWYSIDGSLIISRSTIGSSVTESSLEKLGRLRELEVDGVAKIKVLEAETANISQLKSSDIISLNVDNENELVINKQGSITIGTEYNTDRNVVINGQVSIVGGVSVNNKKIFFNDSAPTSGRYYKGDICFNSNPEARDYIGWVCLEGGTPGQWNKFGNIIP